MPAKKQKSGMLKSLFWNMLVGGDEVYGVYLVDGVYEVYLVDGVYMVDLSTQSTPSTT